MKGAITIKHFTFVLCTTGEKCYKAFYGSNLLIFVKKLECWPLASILAYSIKHCIVVQKLISYGQKKFV
jgi:hypothetical protein